MLAGWSCRLSRLLCSAAGQDYYAPDSASDYLTPAPAPAPGPMMDMGATLAPTAADAGLEAPVIASGEWLHLTCLLHHAATCSEV